MRLKGLDNHHYTNRLIQGAVILTDFVALWVLLSVVTNYIPHAERLNDEKMRLLWMVCTLSMAVSEYWFSNSFHQRLEGAGEILRRSTMLVTVQTLLSYLLLRMLRFTFRMVWPLLIMGLFFLLVIILLRFCERWTLKRIRESGYNTRKATFI